MTNTTTRERITASLESLPSPPFVAVEVLRITNDPEASVHELAEVISNDPVLAARLLKVANSPSFGAGREVTNMDRAMMLLGLKAVKMLALSFSLAPDPGDAPAGLSLGQYWYHSLLNAVTARYWAELVDRRVVEEAFLSGLISHLGRLILAKQTGDRYQEVDPGGRAWPTLGEEARVFGFSSAHVTEQVLREWGLPSLIADCAGAMYLGGLPADLVDAPRESLGTALHLTVLTEQVLAGADSGAYEELGSRAASLGVSAEDLPDVLLHFEERVRELASMFEVSLPEDMSHARMLDLARTALVNVSMETVADLATMAAENSELESKVFTDRLTGIANRAMFDDHLEREVAGAVRHGDSVIGVIIIDIDHFKKFNDTYGHQTGDIVLREVAQAMNKVTRQNELLARYGGEEFALVIRHCTREAAEKAGERLRAEIEALRVQTVDGPLSVTISVGAAFDSITSRADGDRLISWADEALYVAKQDGRNCVRIAG
ncbi:MAG: diguanylate cyclase domain-containing protein [Acidimicrobiales bacterium]